MMDWEEIRKNYPLAMKGGYFNTASFGSISNSVIEEQRKHLDDVLLNGNQNYYNWEASYVSLKSEFSEYLNCSPKNIAFLPDVSLGINKISELLDQDKEVILVEEDFPSVTLPWITRDYDINWIRYEYFINDYLKELEAKLKGGNKILCLSCVFYNHGFRIDPIEVGKLCQKYGCTFILDATQGLGTFSIDSVKANVDFMITSCFKWFMAGYGIAVSYVSDSIFNHFEIKHSGWNFLKNFIGDIDDATNYKMDASRFEIGHIKFHNLNMLSSSFNEMKTIGHEAISQRTIQLSILLREKVLESGLKVLPANPSLPSAITAIQSSELLLNKIKKANIACSPRKDYIRFAVYFYNNEKDIDDLIECLK